MHAFMSFCRSTHLYHCSCVCALRSYLNNYCANTATVVAVVFQKWLPELNARVVHNNGPDNEIYVRTAESQQPCLLKNCFSATELQQSLHFHRERNHYVLRHHFLNE